MIIWVNGPFGGGKTVTAFELARRVPEAVVCDPEAIGFGLHRGMPAGDRGDFKDLRSWRMATVEVLDRAGRGRVGPVVVPMTVAEPRYFDETVGELRRLGHGVCHVGLVTDADEVRRRLRRRGVHGLRRERWALSQIDRCLAALARPEFATPLDTTHRTVGEVADRIADLAGVPIRHDTDGRLRSWARRTHVSLRHLRLG